MFDLYFSGGVGGGGATQIVTITDPVTGQPVQQIIQTQIDPKTGQATQVALPANVGAGQQIVTVTDPATGKPIQQIVQTVKDPLTGQYKQQTVPISSVNNPAAALGVGQLLQPAQGISSIHISSYKLCTL